MYISLKLIKFVLMIVYNVEGRSLCTQPNALCHGSITSPPTFVYGEAAQFPRVDL